MSIRGSFKLIKPIVSALSSFCLLASFAFSQSATAAGSNTILVCTKPGANVQKIKEQLISCGCTILKVAPCNSAKFSVLQVVPNNGNVAATLSTINSVVKNITAAEKTPLAIPQAFQNASCMPDDPDFPGQYALQAMKWSEARCTLRLLGINQRAVPRLTLIDTGCNRVPSGSEMINLQQFNFAGGVLGVPEVPFSGGLHGTAVLGLAAARTNNETFLAGVASHNLPVTVTSCRISNDDANIDTFDVINAMMWCVDNQSARGGPGAINISLNSTALPTYNGSSIIQEIAQSARKQGDLFVNGSGNEGIIDPSPERFIRRVTGLDENNLKPALFNSGPLFNAACPATNIATFFSPNTIGFATGTSLACIHWAGCISLLQSLNPKLNAPKADAIIYRSCDTTSEGYKIPNVNKAVLQTLLLPW